MVGVAGALAALAGTDAPKGGDAALFEAIRNGDSKVVRVMVDKGAGVNAKNGAGETPLMYASMYGSAETVKLMLDKGADPNIASASGETALMLATDDVRKVRMLVEHGALVNTQSATGRTALAIAASRTGGGAVVKYLLDKGAEIETADKVEGIPIVPVGGGKATPLIEAAKIRDGGALRLLLARGANVNAQDANKGTALTAAILLGNRENIRLLIEKGADVNATMNFGGTPLISAAMRNDVETARELLSHGAKVDARDSAGYTALFWAAYSEYGAPALVDLLLKAGADASVKSKAGETALNIAERRGYPAVVDLLRNAGAERRDESAQIRDAIGKSIALLQKSGPQFVKVSGCSSCHHQMLPAMAAAMARQKGIHVDEQAVRQTRAISMAMFKPARPTLIENMDIAPDIPVSGSYFLLSLAADNYPADELTDGVVMNLAAKQDPDGKWAVWAPRPPMEYSAITGTALTLRALQLYAPGAKKDEFARRVERARAWLAAAAPKTTEEKVMKLLGLFWSNAPRAEINAAAASLMGDQRPDGGWAQLATLTSDAYATGQALYALQQAGALTSTHVSCRNGVKYLLRTQFADGSWLVESRAFPFQPLKDSGFPHGRNQWISASGASWAAMALAIALPAE